MSHQAPFKSFLCQLIFKGIQGWRHQHPPSPPPPSFHTSSDFSSSISQCGLIWKHGPRVAEVTLHLVRTIFPLPPAPGGDDLSCVSVICASPTAPVHIDRTAKGSRAHLNPFQLWLCCRSPLSVDAEGFSRPASPLPRVEDARTVKAGPTSRQLTEPDVFCRRAAKTRPFSL